MKCALCDRIEMIKNRVNPYFVKELETGYVVMGAISILKDTLYFFAKNIQRIILSGKRI